MALYTFAKTSPIPSHISQEQLFEVLKIKSRDPVGFLPGVTTSEILEELDPKNGNVFTRKLTFDYEVYQEKVTILPPSSVLFEFTHKPGMVQTTISDDKEGKLHLTFTFRFKNETEKDKATIALVKKAGVEALLTTVEKAERFAKEGKI